MVKSAYVESSRMQIEMVDSIRLALLGRVNCEPKWAGDCHAHEFWELVYIRKEEADPFCMRWDTGEHRGEKAALYLFPPRCSHQFLNTGTLPAQNVYVGFSIQNAVQLSPAAKSIPIVLPCESGVSAPIVAICDVIAGAAEEEVYGLLLQKRYDVMCNILQLARWITEGTEGEIAGVINRNHMLIMQIKETIMRNLNRYISVDELARQLYFSPNYLGQFFRQYTGMTVKNYHNQMRMEYALNLLVAGEASVSEIATQLGFDEVAYFSRRFKEFYGLSPSFVRKNKK